MPIAQTQPAHALRVDDLPERIAASLRQHGAADAFRYALKTALKPDATVPIVWAVITSTAVLLCTTHARRGIWRSYQFSEIDTLRTTGNFTALQIISRSVEEPDLLLPLPAATERAWIDQFMQTYRQSSERSSA